MNNFIARIFIVGAAALMALPASGAATDRGGATAVTKAVWHNKVEASILDTVLAGGEAEILIYMDSQADVSAAKWLSTKEQKGQYVYDTLKSHAQATQSGVLAALTGVEHEPFWIVNTIFAKADLALVQALAERADVAYLYENGYGEVPSPVEVAVEKAQATRDIVDPNIEDNIEQVRAPEAWALGAKGQGVVVGSADTGVHWTHETLKAKYRGWDKVTQTASHDFNWFVGGDPNPVVCPNELTEPCDDDVFLAGGHGTHTTATMVGSAAGGLNQVGMAPEAEWMACRNLDSGIGHVPSYLRCMEFMLAPTDLTGNPTTADPSKAPDVVNNSWGCVEACPPPILKAQLENSTAAGIFYVVSAGNDGDVPASSAPLCSSIQFPLGIYSAAYTVGATNHRTDAIANFSSRGPIVNDVDHNGNPTEPDGHPGNPRIGPDISAPGVSTRAANRGGLAGNNNQYSSLSGTSMAGPHVAGLAALVISANPDLRGQVDLIESIISSAAVPLQPTVDNYCGDDDGTNIPNNTFGHGRIDALAAVQAAIDTDVNALHCTSGLLSDAGSVTFPIASTYPGNILDLNVSLDISHTWIGDLDVSLTHVDTGTSIDLILSPGAGQCQFEDIVALLDDEATVPVTGQCAPTSPSINGTFQPEAGNFLADFDGELMAGTWNLTIVDNVAQDTGTLNRACLIPVTDAPPLADFDADGIPDSSDNCVLTANTDQADWDSDGVGDVCDNCRLVANADQCNTNGNGTGPGEDNFGNVCDADLNNDGTINSFDLNIMRANFGQTGDNDADLNCDGTVNSFDLQKMREDFGGSPGPSGIAP